MLEYHPDPAVVLYKSWSCLSSESAGFGLPRWVRGTFRYLPVLGPGWQCWRRARCYWIRLVALSWRWPWRNCPIRTTCLYLHWEIRWFSAGPFASRHLSRRSSGHPCRRRGQSFHAGCCTRSPSYSEGSLEEQDSLIEATIDFDRSGCHHALIVV